MRFAADTRTCAWLHSGNPTFFLRLQAAKRVVRDTDGGAKQDNECTSIPYPHSHTNPLRKSRSPASNLDVCCILNLALPTGASPPSPLPRRSSLTDHRRMVQRLRRQRRRRPPDLLTSIENLLDEIDQRLDAKLHRIMASHVFVGYIDQQYALVQHNTKLYLVNHHVLRL